MCGVHGNICWSSGFEFCWIPASYFFFFSLFSTELVRMVMSGWRIQTNYYYFFCQSGPPFMWFLHFLISFFKLFVLYFFLKCLLSCFWRIMAHLIPKKLPLMFIGLLEYLPFSHCILSTGHCIQPLFVLNCEGHFDRLLFHFFFY